MKIRRRNMYQMALIFFAFLVLFSIGVFVFKELFPEYKKYQYAYRDLEEFRSSYSGEKPAPFDIGIKQIVIPRADEGPEIIDRCISCHVALELPHFSSTRVARDVNGNVLYDAEGNPALESNPDYVWKKLNEKIEAFRDVDLKTAEKLESLKSITVQGRKIDMSKAIAMHPLIGDETRPFQYHSMSEYGCTSCHSGNGRALVAKRAHGPVYDGEYEVAYDIKKPQFVEKDEENDPLFSRMYNNKPGHELVFQTTPLLAGSLIQAKCVQCHQTTSSELKESLESTDETLKNKIKETKILQSSIKNDEDALIALISLHQDSQEKGEKGVLDDLNKKLSDYRLSSEDIDAYEGQLTFVKKAGTHLEEAIEEEIAFILGSLELAQGLLDTDEIDSAKKVNQFLKNQKVERSEDNFSIFAKKAALAKAQEVLALMENAKTPLSYTSEEPLIQKGLRTNVDRLVINYKRGKELFISQACYACHRIAGFSRSSVGPELTKIGLSYPWYVKESIVWPQADLSSSTMPNFRLDHEDVNDLMTFLMAQKGDTKAISEVEYEISVKEWEAGKKMPWEKALPPTEIYTLQKGMKIFATEGCAACHKLKGFESNVGFANEKSNSSIQKEHFIELDWFLRTVPEQVRGSHLVEIIDKHGEEIDRIILSDVREKGILDEIEASQPGLIESFYSNFKFASRAKNLEYANDPEKLALYKKRLHLLLKAYIQVYGLGRDIAPHLNWSGVFRDTEWLMGHFHNPPGYTARSIMPVMPFDETKFYALTLMLQTLGKKNREDLQEIWRVRGFDPPLAFQLLCSSCHGEQRQGNGVIAEWIYPIPKNLRNPEFLHTLTKERAIFSITHGVDGTPMPPWGEDVSGDKQQKPVLNQTEIAQLVEWLYQGIPYQNNGQNSQEEMKWRYSPDDVVEEMQKERSFLSDNEKENFSTKEKASAYFEARPNDFLGPDKELYYIKKTFYTPENIEAGKEYFLINCATCHGKEGTGAGLRAAPMTEAKPRMFTNLPWIRSRDDLRLLRSIKFGVPGTSMVPWGDQTTAEQRMQLVIFIRQLTSSQLFREDFESLLFDIFDANIQKIEKGRLNEYSTLEKVKKEHKGSYDERQKLLIQANKTDETVKKIAHLYEREINLLQKIEKLKIVDESYVKWMEIVNEEKGIYNTLGIEIIGKELPEELKNKFFTLVKDYPLQYFLENENIVLKIAQEKEEETKELEQEIMHALQTKIDAYQNEIQLLRAKSLTEKINKELQELLEEQGSYINLKTKFVIQLADAKKLREKQWEIYLRLKS